MKREERIARDFLRQRFGVDPIFEPRGQGKPPDFQVGTTAVEGRRLNQQYQLPGGRAEGLEQVEYPLQEAISEELKRITFSGEKGSFWCFLRFGRPLQNGISTIARALARAARVHYNSGTRTETELEFDRVSLRLVPASKPRGRAFEIVIVSDVDSGGWLVGLCKDALGHALKDKIEKTKGIAAEFDRWVLLLVDAMMPGLNWAEDAEPSLSLQLGHFNSVTVISIVDGSLELEWPKASLAEALSANRLLI